jgi:PKD repeat protein
VRPSALRHRGGRPHGDLHRHHAPLQVSVDASASSDSDGTIASYAWNWGDGTPAGSGATAPHTYAAAGTYTVTIVVTDNGGATATTTRPVNVPATPPANPPPTASFTATPTGLQVAVNGSASSDPNGTIASYAWNWGDGTAAGSGAIPADQLGDVVLSVDVDGYRFPAVFTGAVPAS